ncbi:MAG: hybrid sensor histidine kinase/response regulator, partial [Odoribacter sp.]|nr:hybrid sensor histidine kinase/response regulator [Odoribacter sp.]
MIGTFAGLCILDLDNYEFSKYKSYNLQEGSLSHFSVYALYRDKAGTLWVGTYAGGVNYYNPYNRRFVFHDPVHETNSLFGIYGTMVCNKDLLWIAIEGGGLLEMDIKSKKFSQYLLDKNAEVINNKNIIKSLRLESDKLWCGTNDGLIYHFDIHTKKFKLYHQLANGGGIYFVERDSLNNLWMGTTDTHGLICISPDGKEQTTFKVADTTEVYYSNLRCFLEIRKGVYLIGTRNSGAFYLDMNNNNFYDINTEQEKPYRLNNNYISCMMRDSFGKIWIGTFGGGVHQYDEKRGIVKSITTENNLTDDNICAIVE